MQVDETLIHAAERFIDAANVHLVRTWIHCYKLSLPGSARRMRYESLLKGFVRAKNVLRGTSGSASPGGGLIARL